MRRAPCGSGPNFKNLTLSRKSLAHHRRHGNEAIGEDFIVCLECGGHFHSLVVHLLSLHALTSHEYREKWGYPPATALMDIETRLVFSRVARKRLAEGWRPPITRKADDETIRRLFAKGLKVPAIAARTGLTELSAYARLHQLGLSRRSLPNEQLIELRRQGLWVSRIAALTGLPTGTIYSRLERIRERGVRLPPPKGPRPRGDARRVPAGHILTLARKGLTLAAIAAQVGIRVASVKRRLWIFRKRGLLPPLPPRRDSRSIVSDARVLALARKGLGPTAIAERVGLPYATAVGRLASLRRRKLLAPPTPKPIASRLRVSDSTLRALMRAGFGPRLIANRVGLGPSTVKARLKALRSGDSFQRAGS